MTAMEEQAQTQNTEIVVRPGNVTVIEGGPATAIRAEIQSLAKEISNKFMRLSQLLRTVQRDRLYLGWGFDSFEAWAEADSGLHYETARVFVAMEATLVEAAKIPRQTLAEIGWTKAKHLVSLQRAGKLAPKMAEIIQKAKTLPASQFQDYVHQVRASVPTAPGDPVPADRIPVNFFLARDQQQTVIQARRLAEQLTGSTDPGVQLTTLAQEFIGSVTPDEANAPDAYRARRVMMLLDVLENQFGLVVEIKGAKTADGQRLYAALTHAKQSTPQPVATASPLI